VSPPARHDVEHAVAGGARLAEAAALPTTPRVAKAPVARPVPHHASTPSPAVAQSAVPVVAQAPSARPVSAPPPAEPRPRIVRDPRPTMVAWHPAFAPARPAPRPAPRIVQPPPARASDGLSLASSGPMERHESKPPAAEKAAKDRAPVADVPAATRPEPRTVEEPKRVEQTAEKSGSARDRAESGAGERATRDVAAAVVSTPVPVATGDAEHGRRGAEAARLPRHGGKEVVPPDPSVQLVATTEPLPPAEVRVGPARAESGRGKSAHGEAAKRSDATTPPATTVADVTPSVAPRPETGRDGSSGKRESG
jgi:hypothetical protein